MWQKCDCMVFCFWIQHVHEETVLVAELWDWRWSQNVFSLAAVVTVCCFSWPWFSGAMTGKGVHAKVFLTGTLLSIYLPHNNSIPPYYFLLAFDKKNSLKYKKNCPHLQIYGCKSDMLCFFLLWSFANHTAKNSKSVYLPKKLLHIFQTMFWCTLAHVLPANQNNTAYCHTVFAHMCKYMAFTRSTIYGHVLAPPTGYGYEICIISFHWTSPTFLVHFNV